MNVTNRAENKIGAPSEFRRVNTSVLVNISRNNFSNITRPTIQQHTRTCISDESESLSTIVAITEGRGHARGEVGIAAIITEQPSLMLSQHSDNFWYTATLTKLNLLYPRLILMPETIRNSQHKLYQAIRNEYPGVQIVGIPRRHFDATDALAKILALCLPKYESVKIAIENKYYAITACAALLRYLEYFLKIIFAQKSLIVEYESGCNIMQIDVETSRRLELLYPLCATTESKSCLFGVLNHCITNIGKRALRAKILQPSMKASIIRETQDCIKELIGKEMMLAELQKSLVNFVNVDRLIKLSIVCVPEDNLKAAETMLNQIIQLKTTLDFIPQLCVTLQSVGCRALSKVLTELKDERYIALLNKITTVIDVEAQSRRGGLQLLQRLYAVRSNINSLLDITRKKYSELVDTIRDHIDALSRSHEIPYKMHYSVSHRGYLIQFVNGKNIPAPAFPSDIEVVSSRANMVLLRTNELVLLNIRMQDLIDEIYLLSSSIISKLLGDIQQEMDAIYELTGFIVNLDILQSLASVSRHPGYVCPTFGDEIRVVDAIHPLLEYSKMRPICIPNNIIATPEFNFFIITGPNMSGKSIYLKTIAMLQILAQLGCFVPAKSACFRICDKLFSRIGFGDNIEQNASSFTVEIREMEYIFQNITPFSLVIIDEICRSTNPRDGKLLAWKICERMLSLKGIGNPRIDNSDFENTFIDFYSDLQNVVLSSIVSPFIFVTTHFLELTKLGSLYFNVCNLYFHVTENPNGNDRQFIYTHQIKMGVTPIHSYGLKLARSVRLPVTVIPRAELLLRDMCQHDSPNLNASVATTESVDSTTIKRDLYNVSANIASILRTHKDDSVRATSELNKLIANFVNTHADDLQQFMQSAEEVVNSSMSRTRRTDVNATGNKTRGDASLNMAASNANVQQQGSTDVDLSASQTRGTHLSDLSYHSILRRGIIPSAGHDSTHGATSMQLSAQNMNSFGHNSLEEFHSRAGNFSFMTVDQTYKRNPPILQGFPSANSSHSSLSLNTNLQSSKSSLFGVGRSASSRNDNLIFLDFEKAAYSKLPEALRKIGKYNNNDCRVNDNFGEFQYLASAVSNQRVHNSEEVGPSNIRFRNIPHQAQVSTFNALYRGGETSVLMTPEPNSNLDLSQEKECSPSIFD